MLYRIVLFVHVMAVIMWIGTGIVFQVLAEQAARRGDATKTTALAALGTTFGKAYFPALAILVLLSGLWLVIDGEWGFDHVFVAGGLLGIVAAMVTGATVIGPTSERLQQSVAGGAASPDTNAHLVKLRDVGRIDLAVMTIVVFLMTYKPWG
ncbi:MAG TPA: DUF2269 family protein [Actinomycetota bacterium]|nr:DUF2269 family protein [Actinomycetota bacterium]